MAKEKSVKFNFLMNGILTASAFIFPLISYPYVTRILTPSGTGRVDFAVSFVSYFIMIAMLGVPTYGIRACARVRDDKEKLSRTVQELMIINLVLAVFCYIVLAISVACIPRLQQESGIIWISSLGIILNVIGVNWFYAAIEEYAFITIRSLIFKGIALAFMFVFIHDIEDYPMYAVMMILTSSASYVLNFIRLRKHITLKRFSHYDFKPHLKAVLVFFAMAAATTIYTNLDAVMLGFMKDNSEVGYYSSAVKVKQILVSFVTALGAVLLPRLSYYYKKDQMDRFRAMVAKAMQVVFFLSIPITLFFILKAQDTILLLSGEAYLPAVAPMQIIMPTVIFIGITNILGIQIMIPIGREKEVAISVGIGAVVDLILNLCFIPSMGATGAAIGTLAAETVVLIVQLIYLRKMLYMFAGLRIRKVLISTAIASICTLMSSFVLNFDPLIISYILQGAIFFGVFILAEKAIKDDIYSVVVKSTIREIRNRKNG